MIKEQLKRTPVYPGFVRARTIGYTLRAEAQWRRAGRPVPPPPSVKQRALRGAVRRWGLRAFVETGTFRGETTAALLPHVDKIHTIELHEGNYDFCRKRFASYPQVRIWPGNSAEMLPKVLAELDQSALFWLDAHDSGPGTAAADVDPIMYELDAILSHSPVGHVIYIDDARSFEGKDGYPTPEGVAQLVTRHLPRYVTTVADDIIRIEPTSSHSNAGTACH